MPAPTPAAARRDADLETWVGFLWASPEGWARTGAPLVSEQFMAGGPEVVDPPLATRLADLDGAVVTFVKEPAFWYGQALKRDDWEPQRRGEPRVLVKLRGTTGPTIVHLSLVEGSGRESPVSLRAAHLISIEYLDPAWLAAWRPIFRAPGSIWVAPKDGPTADSDVRKSFLQVAIDALIAMRAVPAAKGDDLVAARAIDSNVSISTKFRHRIENQIQRWVVAEANELRVTLPTKLALPTLPPTAGVRNWFSDAKTRAEFLARAALNWKGDPEDFDVAHYEDKERNGGIWYEDADLETIQNGWTDERYVAIRATTLQISEPK